MSGGFDTVRLLQNARLNPYYESDAAVLEKLRKVMNADDLARVCADKDGQFRIIHVLLGSPLHDTPLEFARQCEFLSTLNMSVCMWEPRWLRLQNAARKAVGEAPIDYRTLSTVEAMSDAMLHNLFANHEFLPMLDRVAAGGQLEAFRGVVTRPEEQRPWSENSLAYFKLRKVLPLFGDRYDFYAHKPWYPAPAAANALDATAVVGNDYLDDTAAERRKNGALADDATRERNFAELLGLFVTGFAQFRCDVCENGCGC